MRVFVTGASGWVGSATVDDLVAAGHEVAGLARSAESAAALQQRGVRVVRGSMDDDATLRRGALDADAVVHLANKHDWANPAENNRALRASVAALGDALVGTNKPFVVAGALAGVATGRSALETDASPAIGPDSMRGGDENLALSYVARDVRTVITRLAPSVHGPQDRGFVSSLVATARRRGVSGYVGDGVHAWAAVARTDAARLIRIGVEKANAGDRLHAVGEDAVPTRQIAEAIGKFLDVPVVSVPPEAALDHFGSVGRFFAIGVTASSNHTQRQLGWTPTGATLTEDIAGGAYRS